jgi:tRNA (guanine-N7-)-methyltransferase
VRGSKRKRLPLQALAPFLLELPDPPRGAFDWRQIFANDRPVEMEIGFGKGLFLLTAAQANPETNYVGVEMDRGLQLYAATRIAKRNLTNARLIKADARLFLRDCVKDESVRAVHVYFPDPWWKKRHKKRRVFTEDFAIQCQRVLEGGGRLLIATDVEEYFAVMSALIAERTKLARDEGREPPSLENDPTNFERKARLQGRQVHRACFRK